MKIDHDYLKRLLEAFESSPEPAADVKWLEKEGFADNERVLIFHMRILDDYGLIERTDKEPGFGHDDAGWLVTDLRLTARGHEFLEALRNQEVWNTIKREFKDASVSTLLRVAKDLLEGYTKKKVETLLG